MKKYLHVYIDMQNKQYLKIENIQNIVCLHIGPFKGIQWNVI